MFLPLPGATTAPSLIFILPGLFYIRIIPANQEPLNSRPKIQVGTDVSRWEGRGGGQTMSRRCSVVTFELMLPALFSPPGCMFHSSGLRLHDHEPDLHRAGLDQRTEAKPRRPLSQGRPEQNPDGSAGPAGPEQNPDGSAGPDLSSGLSPGVPLKNLSSDSSSIFSIFIKSTLLMF